MMLHMCIFNWIVITRIKQPNKVTRCMSLLLTLALTPLHSPSYSWRLVWKPYAINTRKVDFLNIPFPLRVQGTMSCPLPMSDTGIDDNAISPFHSDGKNTNDSEKVLFHLRSHSLQVCEEVKWLEGAS